MSAPPTTGVCGQWITREDVIACCSGLKDPPNTSALDRAIGYATDILFAMSGRRYPGLCTRTVRPCYGDNCGCGGPNWLQWPLGGWSYWVWDQAASGWAFPALPYRIDGQWFNFGNCNGQCNLSSVSLPKPASLGEDSSVVIDGFVLSPAAYTMEQYQRIVRLDGNTWPCTQDRAKDSSPYPDPNNPDGSKQGTWQITYTYGRTPGRAGQVACARFACEMAKFLCNSDDCVLPQRLKHIVREGVEMDFADPLTFLDEPGRVGIYEVDLWLKSTNPGGLARRSTIRRLDGPTQFRGFT